MGKGGDVFVLDMGEPVRILDLAQNMIRLHGLKPYITDEIDTPDCVMGDIGIKIVGLNKGEKLYEELLIGENAFGTEHSRILCATEVSLPKNEVKIYLERLEHACSSFDIAAVREIFLEAPLSYRPSSDVVHDLMWISSGGVPGPNQPILTLVKKST
jgi:FlaA1/EpsC-like NDP-sugar epimerase